MVFAAASLRQRADELVAGGRAEEAFALLLRRAAIADSEALATLAFWRLSGQIIARDLAESRDYFRRAGDAGDNEAAMIHIAFLANGTGGASDWSAALNLLQAQGERDPGARRQLDIIGRMRLTADGDPADPLPDAEPLSERPWAVRIPSLFSPAECAYLAEAATPLFAPSVVVDPQTGRQIANPVRTSDAAGFPLIFENPAIHALNRRIAAASATTVAQGEPLQVLRYAPGQQYKPHIDALPETDNQRVLTMLVYLNEDYEGGETQFIANGLSVRGKTGDALLFRNAGADGRPDKSAQHAGLPVKRGVKLIASRWIRARPLDLSGPTRRAG